MSDSPYKILFAAIWIFVLWYLFAIEYRRYRIGVLRHHLFEARDRLFEEARKGSLSFDDRAYGIARGVINGFLRYADTLALPQLVLIALARRFWNDAKVQQQFETRLADARAELSMAGKHAVDAALAEANFCVLSHVLHISWILGPALQVLKLFLRLKSGQSHHHKKIVDQLRRSVSKSKVARNGLAGLDDEVSGLAPSPIAA